MISEKKVESVSQQAWESGVQMPELRMISKLLLIALCLSVLAVEARLGRAVAETTPIEPAYPILREVQYGFTLRNKTNRLKQAEFWTYAPVKLTSTQRCLKLESSHPYRLIADDLGNQILHFRFEDLSPHAFIPITIRASLGLSDIPNPAPIADLHRFLRSEKYIESDHPEINRFAKQFESDSSRKTAEKVFRWVAGNIRNAGYLRDGRGALYAFRNKQGDCTEYMYLFAALCRAKGIPARGIGGYVCAENSILEPAAYHNWAEFYEEGTWKIGDAQKNVLMENSSHYIAMRIVGESPETPMGEFNRFRSVGEGVEVKMMTSRNK